MSNTKDLLKQHADDLVQLFKTTEFKNSFVKAVNDDVDIPLLNEKTERKIFNRLYNLVVEEVDKLLHNESFIQNL
jgi:hypothetical protein